MVAPFWSPLYKAVLRGEQHGGVQVNYHTYQLNAPHLWLSAPSVLGSIDGHGIDKRTSLALLINGIV